MPWITCVQVTCHISLERFRWKLQLFFRPHFNRRFAQEVLPPKCWEFQFQKIWNSQRGSPWESDIWVQTLWLITKNIIKRGWWLPPSPNHGEFYESMYACDLFMHQKCSNYALTNLLFSLCRSIWIIDLLATRCNPYPRALTCPFYPQSVANVP